MAVTIAPAPSSENRLVVDGGSVQVITDRSTPQPDQTLKNLLDRPGAQCFRVSSWETFFGITVITC